MSEIRREQASEEDQERAMMLLGSPRCMEAVTGLSSESQGVNLPRLAIRYVLLDHDLRLGIMEDLGLINAFDRERCSWSDARRRIIEGAALERALCDGKIAELSARIDAAFDARGSQA